MAYDEHWSGSTPGPVASLAWCAKVADYATSAIDSDKIVMGLPLYGRAWQDKKLARALRYEAVQDLAAEKSSQTSYTSPGSVLRVLRECPGEGLLRRHTVPRRKAHPLPLPGHQLRVLLAHRAGAPGAVDQHRDRGRRERATVRGLVADRPRRISDRRTAVARGATGGLDRYFGSQSPCASIRSSQSDTILSSVSSAAVCGSRNAAW